MIETIEFLTVDKMFDFFAPWGDDSKLGGYIFRGHSQESYQLIPTALRLDNNDWFWNTSESRKPIEPQQHWQEWQEWQVRAEYSILRAFYRLADQRGLDVPISERMRLNLAQNFDIFGLNSPYESEQWIPKDLLETAALAQHYGMPTRLLDWTYDIFVALYFALTGAIEKDGNLEIWALNKEYISFLRNTVNKINIEFITPHYAINPNLNAQKGLFTHWPTQMPSMIAEAELFKKGITTLVDRRPLDILVSETYELDENISLFKRFTLPCSEAKKGCKILSRFGYDAARIFPGYDGVAKHLLNQYKLN